MGISATDAEVIAASADNPEAFVALFDRHFDELYRYLARRVGPDLGEDLAAETFARAFDTRRRYFREQVDALPWLYGIAVNLLRKHWRTEERRLRAYAREEARRAAEPNGRLDQGSQVASLLAGLSAEEREVLLLYAWADLSYEDIAAALGVPVGTVRSRLNRARTHARETLALEALSPTEANRG
jgi:RNA polymerase sigma-70 factor (ECF subfamily)